MHETQIGTVTVNTRQPEAQLVTETVPAVLVVAALTVHVAALAS